MKLEDHIRHAYEVCAQIAEQHIGCAGAHPRTCAELIAEGVRNTQGGKNPSPRCARQWRSVTGHRSFTCPRRKDHPGDCGDNTNKRRLAGEWKEACSSCASGIPGQWRDGSLCESCGGSGVREN